MTVRKNSVLLGEAAYGKNFVGCCSYGHKILQANVCKLVEYAIKYQYVQVGHKHTGSTMIRTAHASSI